jgi:CheY-like chemotaxis protein
MIYSRLLVIDDDEDDLEIFEAAVNELEEPVSCELRNNAATAFEELKGGSLVPDVIFLDLNMPVMNGRQFLVAIKQLDELKDIPVIIFSTSSHSETIEDTRSLGASGFVTKPNSFAELVKVLQNHLSK